MDCLPIALLWAVLIIVNFSRTIIWIGRYKELNYYYYYFIWDVQV